MAAIFILALTHDGYCQSKDTINRMPIDSIKITKDTLRTDTSKVDTASKKNLETKLGIKISKDALPSVVTATAIDSAVLDMRKNIFYLYGNAQVNFDNLQLNSGKISYAQTSNMVTAEPIYDSVGTTKVKPTFKQGNETFTFDSMQYNFKSKRAIVRNPHTKYGEGFVFSDQVKRNPDQSIFGMRNLYTTCALDTPHFGIRARRIKVIPNRVIASGPAVLEIEGVPTPLYLPFGLFPITESQRSGFRIPAYTLEQQRGLGLTNGGYYFYLNDHADLMLLSNLYSKGSWSIDGTSNYKSIYHYSGTLSLHYAYNKTGEVYEPGASITKDFMLNWRHQADAKALPGTNFSASVQVGTSSYYSNTSYDVNQILNNQYSSNISYSKSWIGTPFNLSVAARHNQNTQNHLVSVSLPELSFSMSAQTPFKRKTVLGSAKWYEKITVGYSFRLLNQTTFYDSTFSFDKAGSQNFKNGMVHSIPLSASYNVLRFFNLSFNSSYNEYWLTEKHTRSYNDITNAIDTIANKGFFAARDFNTSANLSTRIYGLKMFKKGKLAGIRHVISPNIGVTYTPDFAAAPFSNYYRTRLDTSSRLTYLSPYENSIVGTPGLGQYGKFSSNINYGLGNNLQIKIRTKGASDSSATKNVTLIDAFNISGAYNAAADSFNWSPLRMDFRTSIANKLSISGSAGFDPYGIDYNTGRRLPQTLWDRHLGLVRFTNAQIALSSSFRSASNNGNADKPAVKTDEYNRLMQNNGYGDYVDFNIPWGISFSYSLNLQRQWSAYSHNDTDVVTQSLRFNGDFNLTPRWKIAYSSGYDFVNHQLTLTSFDIYRDLHCMEMRMGLIPFGPRKSYNFSLNVKASILQDLKLLRRRDYRDTVY
jgi:hypothetical protein